MATLSRPVLFLLTTLFLFYGFSAAFPSFPGALEPRCWKKGCDHCERWTVTIDHPGSCNSVNRDNLKAAIDSTFVNYAGNCRGEEAAFNNQAIPGIQGIGCRVTVHFPRGNKGVDWGGLIGSNLVGTASWAISGTSNDGSVHCGGACQW
ncbi:hypothetical protein CGCF415_v006817 [Colletotrichum fructicola]|uniref:Uncharacterized protein n=5 Tax=Colletotrichum gloeosporioides species complex TaxID=2707338 RepID=L2G5C1_COLFN|nr:uncharacterized protein CGMCC3_g1689 [Colletotrichum fructicola]XP_036496209.1 uncharacterized protein CGCS363_v007441 [Colletotrichum siamense]XP_045268880.1 uncharacterized protein GCG54_00005262 [Colletotrichum gloeosporioides]XP_053041589.1 uncharacterized protein COL26b_001326 [Colletotrichum chrysophilum]EQB56387.1 hypothetical protein CGLO_03602 [Colletotrichum gloeosporioides Cg-14]KAF4485226.1 hypothetical protein CGGC5_v008412 [Colletotrichum fructicola Nara gc5]KAF4832820.1 hypo